jgi:Flp pilus assembly pilin Flp
MVQWLLAYPRVRNKLAASGQGLVEYALLITLVAVISIVVITALAPGLADFYQFVIDRLRDL